ncbi:MAG: hypothetical protein AAGF89_03965 [Bacteroidota bacterium]
MKRIQLFEFEDFAWLPSQIRSGMTRLIRVLHRMNGTATIISQLLIEIRQKHPFLQIVDMGSGSGGPMLEVIDLLKQQLPHAMVRLLLTDAYPDKATVKSINNLNRPDLSYSSTPLFAEDVGQAPGGIKTMVASFHHLRPEMARQVLKAAEDSRQPLFLYELAPNSVPLLVWCLLLPLSLSLLFIMSWAMTPFVRPLSFPQLVFTYIIPIIPLAYAWDGQASLMRTYTFKDIEELLENRKPKQYAWEMKRATKSNGRPAGYYVFGYPT